MVRSINEDKKWISKILTSVFSAVLFLPLIDFSGISIIVGNVFDYITMASCIILIFALCVVIHKLHYTYFLFGSFFLLIGISTYINGLELLPAVYYAAKNICMIVLIDYYSKKQKLSEIISIIKKIMGVVILINLYFQIFDQDIFGYTISHNYANFLASDNFLGYYYISFILVVYLDSYNSSKRKFRGEVLFWSAICLISLLRAWAATCLVVFVLFDAAILFDVKHIFSKIGPFKSFLINMFISAMVIFFHIQNLFKWLIVDVLHKSMTLSNRVYVWEAALANIAKKPIFGHGTAKGGRLSINYVYLLNRTYFSHNVFLEVLIQGGVIALISLAVIYFAAGKEMKKCTDQQMKFIINLSVFSILLMQFSELSIYIPFANLPLILCFFCKQLQNEKHQHI